MSFYSTPTHNTDSNNEIFEHRESSCTLQPELWATCEYLLSLFWSQNSTLQFSDPSGGKSLSRSGPRSRTSKMPPPNHTSESFVDDGSPWARIRYYRVSTRPEDFDVRSRCHVQLFESASSASSTTSVQTQAPSVPEITDYGHHPSVLAKPIHDNILPSQQPLPEREPISSACLLSPPLSNNEDLRLSNTFDLPRSYGYSHQNACPYHIPGSSALVSAGASLQIIHQQPLAQNHTQQSTVVLPGPQDQTGTSGYQPLQSSHPQEHTVSAPNMRYRLTLVPILINGRVHNSWYPLPEIFCLTAQQVMDQGRDSARQTLDPPTPRNFRPTNMALEQSRISLTNLCDQRNLEVNSYRGDPSSQVNRRQIHQLPDTHNCTLWLWNIPASIHVSEIFDKIDTGAVQCFHMVPPNDNHSTCAAKLAFTTPEAAVKFKQKANSLQGIWLKNLKLKVRYNRDGNLRNDTQQSRVLIIEGPCDLMTLPYWEAYFRRVCVFQWDRVLGFPCKDISKKILQFSFVRLDGQAQVNFSKPVKTIVKR